MMDTEIMMVMHWDEQQLRMAPEWRIEQIEFRLHLKNVAEKAANHN